MKEQPAEPLAYSPEPSPTWYDRRTGVFGNLLVHYVVAIFYGVVAIAPSPVALGPLGAACSQLDQSGC